MFVIVTTVLFVIVTTVLFVLVDPDRKRCLFKLLFNMSLNKEKAPCECTGGGKCGYGEECVCVCVYVW